MSQWLLSRTPSPLQLSIDSVMKNEANFIDFTEPVASLDLLEETSASLKVLGDAMCPTFAHTMHASRSWKSGRSPSTGSQSHSLQTLCWWIFRTTCYIAVMTRARSTAGSLRTITMGWCSYVGLLWSQETCAGVLHGAPDRTVVLVSFENGWRVKAFARRWGAESTK